MRKGSAVVRRIVRSLVVLGIAVLIASCFDNNKTTDVTTTTETNNAKEQIVNARGVYVAVPSDWDVEQESNGDTYVYPTDGGLLELFADADYEDDGNTTLTQLYQAFVDGMEEDGDIFLDDVPQVHNMGNAVVFRSEIDATINGEDYAGWTDFITTGNRVYALIFIVPLEDVDSRSTEILSILDSAGLDVNETPVLEMGDISTLADGNSGSLTSTGVGSGNASDRPETDISSEFLSAMDSYEAFFTEYVDFMKRYNEDSSNPELLVGLSDMMQREAEMIREFQAWKDRDLTPAESAYYLEVQSRINVLLAEVS